ncbi:hypothetical protein ACR30L_07965 [Psychromonas sp. PT13]|uniref:hypothetical protein n=1 Tax=Psychromonas sp. PT13 TaxID=3439547 RepID=UPI003EBDBBC7
MATVNITKQFKSLLTDTIRFRAEVLVLDETLNRVKVQWGDYKLWVTATLSLAVGDQVLVEDEKVVSKLPDLPYLQVEIS